VEVLVAAAILAAGMVAVLRGFSVAAHALDTAQQVLTVSTRMENTLAELELAGWPRRELGGAPAGRWDTPVGGFAWQAGGERWMVTTNAVLTRVVVRVTPEGRSRESYTIGTAWLGWPGK